eukprot:5257465-Pyramimonas_sp.AAC.1
MRGGRRWEVGIGRRRWEEDEEEEEEEEEPNPGTILGQLRHQEVAHNLPVRRCGSVHQATLPQSNFGH